jgi:hypothetical protein
VESGHHRAGSLVARRNQMILVAVHTETRRTVMFGGWFRGQGMAGRANVGGTEMPEGAWSAQASELDLATRLPGAPS